MPDRAMLFIDGNNWYHALRAAGLTHLGELNYSKISRRLIGPREWVGTRYYVGQVRQEGNTRLYADQRAFLARLQATDRRITTHLGRLEPRSVTDKAAEELRQYLSTLQVRIDTAVFHHLGKLAQRHSRVEVFVEKAVDVMIAVDMVTLAHRDGYDAAYLLSADGDFTPAVQAIRSLGKKVYAASPGSGAQLAASVNAYIKIDSAWLADCVHD